MAIGPYQSVFKNFVPSTDIVAATNESTAPLFGSTNTKSAPFRTGSNSSYSDQFMPMYDGITTASMHIYDSLVANVSYGAGTGSYAINYRMLTNKLLDNPTGAFQIAGTSSCPNIIAFVFPRERFRDRLDPGNWELHITASAPATTRSFVDDSSLSSGTYTAAGLRGNIYSGTIATGPHTGAASGGVVGQVFYDQGIILFNASNSLVPFYLSTFANPTAANITAALSIEKTVGRSTSLLQSTHYFVRLFNSEFNFSNNPSFASPTNGNLMQTTMLNDPHVFPTTVGLYNDNNELLALAKLSDPIEKSFSDEAIIQIRLDY